MCKYIFNVVKLGEVMVDMTKGSRAITVSQLNNYIKQVFEAEELLHGVEVVGEIDGLRGVGASGAVYFSIKDKEAVINCVCYYPQKMAGVENGAQVVVRGTVSYWHKAGKISFVVSSCEAFGFGKLFLQFEELKRKLEQEGFFDVGKKKQLPSEVKRIGVVTSKHGAVLHDIKTVAHRRNPNVDIILFPVAVQGTGAEREIAQGISFFAEYNVDIIIVARGGGSSEDLAAFNTEVVARSVFTSKVPVISAVGHETDWTLVDFVADLRAPTPSAAAELAVAEIVSVRDRVMGLYKHVRYALVSKQQAFGDQIRRIWSLIRGDIQNKLQNQESRVLTASGIIESHNPLAVLKRGYAKVYKDGTEVVSVDDVEVNDKLDIKLYNGEVGVQVWTKKSQK